MFVLFYSFIFISAGISFAQEKTTSQLQTELISPWLVTVDGEARTLTLRITGAAQKPDGTLVLETVFGWTDGNQTAISATARQVGQQSTLQFVTQPGSRVVATQGANGTFEGTFTLMNGITRPVKIQKVSEDELLRKVSAAKAGPFIKPADNVPDSCAGFFGGWTGNWGAHGGEQWIWIVQVDANCMAKYQTGRTGYRGPFETAEIRKGVLSTAGAQGGTIQWSRHGDELWASYSGTAGTTSAVHKKVQIETK
jgi:hypothetical protein